MYVNKFVTTTTTEASQQQTGNGRVVAVDTTSSSTDVRHKVISTVYNSPPPSVAKAFDATELLGVANPVTRATAAALAAAPEAAVFHTTSDGSEAEAPCGANGAMLVYDASKGLCLNVIGATVQGAFSVSTSTPHVVNTATCAASATDPALPNQAWAYSQASGTFTHVATGLALSLGSTSVQDNTPVALAPLQAGASWQEWHWFSPVQGGTIVTAVNALFSLTDSRVAAGAAVGPPVHMWHLNISEPSGVPNGNWRVKCA